MNATILSIIHKLFNERENQDKNLSFQEIYNAIESTLSAEWKSHNVRGLSDDKLTENKMGEIYKLLTLDGGFIRHEDGTWSKRKINEAF